MQHKFLEDSTLVSAQVPEHETGTTTKEESMSTQNPLPEKRFPVGIQYSPCHVAVVLVTAI
jgi:hypothetical protein